jgi:hypothetical protein
VTLDSTYGTGNTTMTYSLTLLLSRHVETVQPSGREGVGVAMVGGRVAGGKKRRVLRVGIEERVSGGTGRSRGSAGQRALRRPVPRRKGEEAGGVGCCLRHGVGRGGRGGVHRLKVGVAGYGGGRRGRDSVRETARERIVSGILGDVGFRYPAVKMLPCVKRDELLNVCFKVSCSKIKAVFLKHPKN